MSLEMLKGFITRSLDLIRVNGRGRTTLKQETTGKPNQSSLTGFVPSICPHVKHAGTLECEELPDDYEYEPEEIYTQIPSPPYTDDHPNWNVKAHEGKCRREIERLKALNNIKYLWEILVPTEWHEADEKGVVNWASDLKPIRTRHHRVWDAKVIDITGGLTILGKVKGQWVSKEGRKYEEGMIACRILCTSKQIDEIATFTLSHYRQLEVMYYKLSNEAHIIRASDVTS